MGASSDLAGLVKVWVRYYKYSVGVGSDLNKACKCGAVHSLQVQCGCRHKSKKACGCSVGVVHGNVGLVQV